MATDALEKKSFKDTLNLPKTDFPIRPNAKIDDKLLIQRWEQEKLFTVSYTHNLGNEKFILHDGPPYANGHIHIGHAYNKILKDIAGKSQRMLGKQVPIKPGWDCHGLPIEKKVTDENPGLDVVQLKKACRSYAQKWIEVQKEEFKQLGVLMDWDNPYATMSFEYEASILKAFGIFVANGYIERKNKTVPWCASCQTVLASAEIEYEERKDPSIYVLFPLEQEITERLFPTLSGKLIHLLVWTTTPWTLPLNRAVLLRPSTEYVIMAINDTYVIVAKAVAAKIAALLQKDYTIEQEFSSDDLIAQNARVLHPFVPHLKVPILADASVSLEDGTACVHCAPGCGPIDYEVGVKNNLEIFSPIAMNGTYTAGIMLEELEGMSVADGQIWVIKKLAELNRLFYKTSLKHSYPHCWRCHNGLIFRATRQWFCDLSKGDLRNRVLGALETITTIPEKSINRLKATIEGRLEWCLSRQRVWGVPIPALLCNTCDYTYVTQGLIDRVADAVKKEGIEYWDIIQASDLLQKGFQCPLCTNTEFRKETDILDVWFDSGVSHFAVLLNDANLAFPASLYLEGSDQHRGWFQSSLLTALVLEGSAPMQMIFTHGFVVDQQGRKMSKSLGNVVAPADIIATYGTDGLRLWASSLDCSGDAVVSDTLLKNIGQVFSKIRNTCRFLLSNLYDFDHAKDALPLDNLLTLDQYALEQLAITNEEIIKHYQDFDFTAIFHKLGDYCSVSLSAFYLDIIKDRLYVEKADGFKRRSAQTACWHILDTLTKLMAPILSFTAEQVSDLYQKDKKVSIHLQNFAQSISMTHNFEDSWHYVKTMRSAVLKEIEGLREKGIVKLPLETRVVMHLDETAMKILKPLLQEIEKKQDVISFLKEFFIVSQLEIQQSSAGLNETAVKGFWLSAEPARGTKCPRCWQWDEQVDEQGLCRRCQEVLGE